MRLSTDSLWSMYQSGMTLAQVGWRVGTSSEAVRERLLRAGYTLRPSGPVRLTEAQLDDVARRYESGERVDDIAAAYGLSASAVRKRLRRAGVEMRRPGVTA